MASRWIVVPEDTPLFDTYVEALEAGFGEVGVKMFKVVPENNKKRKRVEPTLVEPASDEIDDLESKSDYDDEDYGRVRIHWNWKRAKPLPQRMPPCHLVEVWIHAERDPDTKRVGMCVVGKDRLWNMERVSEGCDHDLEGCLELILDVLLMIDYETVVIYTCNQDLCFQMNTHMYSCAKNNWKQVVGTDEDVPWMETLKRIYEDTVDSSLNYSVKYLPPQDPTMRKVVAEARRLAQDTE